jgi:hypothetical protein
MVFNPFSRRRFELSPSVTAIGGPSHTTQKPSGIGSLHAYSCPYKIVSDLSNVPNASSLLLICVRIAIAVGVLWFYLKPGAVQAHFRHGIFPGTFQSRDFSRPVPNWLYVYDTWHITNGSSL